MTTLYIMLQVLVTILVILIVSIIGFFKWHFTYWQRRGVSCTLPLKIPFGNMGNMITKGESMFELLKTAYSDLKSRKLEHGGIYLFTKPIWIPVDLDLIRNVLIKDSSYFLNHGIYINEKSDPLSMNLFSLENEKWKQTRAALTHVFTGGKIKMMFHLMLQCAENLEKILTKYLDQNESIDVKDYLSRFTMDVIASAFFGLELNNCENPDNDFRKYGKRSIDFSSPLEAFRLLISILLPKKWLKAFNFQLTKQDVAEFFFKVVKDAVEYREKNNVGRRDFLQLLIQLKDTGSVHTTEKDGTNHPTNGFRLSMNEITAEALTFFVAGYETSSTTSTFALLELCLNQEIQDNVRSEIQEVLKKYDGQLTYEACTEMSYLENVIKETLRRYPPAPASFRICNKNYQIPGSKVVIEKDTVVMIPTIGVHHDSDIYQEPEKFDPERFNEKTKSIPNNAFLAFGEGPRMCIGMRFGIIQVKVALVTILRKYTVSLNKEKTIFPVVFDPKALVGSPLGGVWLNIRETKL